MEPQYVVALLHRHCTTTSPFKSPNASRIRIITIRLKMFEIDLFRKIINEELLSYKLGNCASFGPIALSSLPEYCNNSQNVTYYSWNRPSKRARTLVIISSKDSPVSYSPDSMYDGKWSLQLTNNLLDGCATAKAIDPATNQMVGQRSLLAIKSWKFSVWSLKIKCTCRQM